MESPPSFSTHSEPQLISEDSGLLITSGSFSSDSASGWPLINSEIQESDYDDKSLSLCESLETTERMCTDNFNTVKKGGPHKIVLTTIDPPPEFQDSPPTGIPRSNSIDCIANLLSKLDPVTLEVPSARPGSPKYGRSYRYDSTCEWRQCFHQRFASPRILHRSPCHSNRPVSRNSLTSRLSSSHNSLTTQSQTDDSTFITQAISHDTLSTTGRPVITDMYNVPFDSEFYAIPIDSIKPGRHKLKKDLRTHRKHYRNGCISSPVNIVANRPSHFPVPIKPIPIQEGNIKRHSVPGTSFSNGNYQASRDARQMTLREVRNYLNTLYSSSSESESKNYAVRTNKSIQTPYTISRQTSTELIPTVLKGAIENNNNNTKKSKNSFTLNAKAKKDKEYNKEDASNNKLSKPSKHKQSPVKFLTFNLKQTFCNLFRFKRSPSGDGCNQDELIKHPPSLVRRALPPLPKTPRSSVRKNEDETVNDFATSIEKVKDYGWYWGPLSVEAAEKILSNEPDGSFIVRDSSDDHYIFSLTFKLHGMRHVRIEHEQGNFSFGGCTMFKAQTIVEFIENAVETSRSGRYLFFLNLRPALGPVRVQLLYPVSRFKRVQSLQHMCRFVILKTVRKDLVSKLPLPRRLLDYLSVAHYYSELQLDN